MSSETNYRIVYNPRIVSNGKSHYVIKFSSSINQWLVEVEGLDYTTTIDKEQAFNLIYNCIYCTRNKLDLSLTYTSCIDYFIDYLLGVGTVCNWYYEDFNIDRDYIKELKETGEEWIRIRANQ